MREELLGVAQEGALALHPSQLLEESASAITSESESRFMDS
jgi:hypothetical protein